MSWLPQNKRLWKVILWPSSLCLSEMLFPSQLEAWFYMSSPMMGLCSMLFFYGFGLWFRLRPNPCVLESITNTLWGSGIWLSGALLLSGDARWSPRQSAVRSFSASKYPARATLCACMLSRFRHVRLFVTPWTIACQAALSLGILQAKVLEWVAMPSSRGSSWPRDWTCISYVSSLAGGFFTTSSIWEAPGATLEEVILQKLGMLIIRVWKGSLFSS